MRRSTILAAVLACAAGPAQALEITSYGDILTGRAAFLAGGPTLTVFDWSTQFAPNAHSPGVLNPSIGALDSLTVNGNSVVKVAPSSLNLANWLDGPGFDAPGGGAAADLAINGVESFDITFAAGHRSVGFAVATGQGNPVGPGPIFDFDFLGATFEFTALDENDDVLGSALFALAAGGPDAAWLTIAADEPFRRLQVREVNAPSVADQYFSNILVAVERVETPEAPAAPLFLAALLTLAGWRARKR